MTTTPIADYALLSDRHSAALVQAFSHIGLVNAAWAISQSERQAPTT